MRKFITIFAVFAGLISLDASAQVFTSWNFNKSDTLPSVGTGIFKTVGGVTRGAFVAGIVSGGTDFAYNSTTYPAASAASGTAGIEAATSTSGKTGIVISFYIRGSNTASKYYQIQYTTNGTDFLPFALEAPGVGSNSEGTTSEVESGLIKLTAGATFYFVQAKLAAVLAVENNENFAFRVVSAFSPTGTSYVATSPTGTYGTSGTVRFDNISISSNNILPVALKSFTASLINYQPVLNWRTANETNFSHFSVEKSTDAKSFYEIAKVDAKHNNSGGNYEYVDFNKSLTQQYYRLKMVDVDGKFAHSAIVAVSGKEAVRVSAYPNPVSSTLLLAHPKATAGASIRVVSALGKVVAQLPVATGATQTSMNVSKLVKASYLVVFDNNGSKQTTQLIKQ